MRRLIGWRVRLKRPAQAGLDERIEVAVEHGLRVAGFVVGAQIPMRDWSST